MTHQFRVQGLVSQPSGAVNDDGIDVLDRMAWVLDGATGISSDRLLPGPSDAAWFCSTIRQGLLDADGSAPSNRAALERALSRSRVPLISWCRVSGPPSRPSWLWPGRGRAMSSAPSGSSRTSATRRTGAFRWRI